MSTTFKTAAIAATAAAAFGITGPVMADVKVYGMANVSVGSLSNTNGGIYANGDGVYIGNHSSRFGVKGSFNLENGMKAIFKHETEVDYAQDSGSYGNERNTYVGLTGDFGSIKLGNHDMPHKLAMKKAEVWGDGYGDYNAIIGPDTRQPGVVLYENKFGDASIALAYAPSGSAANLGASVTFKAGPVDLGLGYESNSGAANASTGARATMDIGDATVSFVYNLEGGATSATQYHLSGKLNMGNGMVLRAQYGRDEAAGKELTAAGISKKLGESTEVYALHVAGDLKGDFNAGATATSIGLVQKF